MDGCPISGVNVAGQPSHDGSQHGGRIFNARNILDDKQLGTQDAKCSTNLCIESPTLRFVPFLGPDNEKS